MPTSLGRVQPIFKGAYDSATTYKKLDNVFYNGDTWVCQIDNTVNVTPSAESNAWQMVASKGGSGGFGAPSGSAEMLPQGFNPTINITTSGPDTEKIFNFQFGIPAGADGTQTYLSSVAPTSSGGYNYFPVTALLSPSGITGGSPRQGDLVFYHNSYYQAAGITDPILGARCGQAYTLVISAASDQQVQDAVDEYLSNHPTVTGTFTNEAKNALLTLLEKVAYTVSDGQTYLETLRTELFKINVDSISAVFTQGSAVIYDTDSLDTLKQYLVVTANYSDGTSAEVTTYTLSGTLSEGTSTITVTYGGKTATFDVVVSDMMVNDMLTLDGIQNTRSGHNASATTWEDLSGNNHDFVAQSGATLMWGDNYAKFDATNRVMKCVADLQGSGNALTIELVVVNDGNGSTALNNQYQGMVLANIPGWSDVAGQFKFYSYRSASDNGISTRYGSTSLTYTGIAVAKYIAYVFNGTTMVKYVNGVASNPVNVTYQSGTKSQNWAIGGNNNGDQDGGYFNGKIYRIGISASAMTAEEIASRYAFFAERFGLALTEV